LFHFYKTPAILKSISKSLIWNAPSNEKTIYLTFDDGPVPNLTEYIVETLKNYKASATFFCVGDNIRKYPAVFKKVIQHGHTIGNHTFNHLKGWSSRNDLYLENIHKCQQIIEQNYSSERKALFRPPYGQITIKQIQLLKESYNFVMWDVLAYDFNESHTPEKSLKKIIKATNPGSIVVFHDNYNAEKKLKYMLPKFLDHFKGLGFEFKKLEFG
jgi:peptidoglycan/xylan/chitin deacetylase (PgdA/CDA1 family)